MPRENSESSGGSMCTSQQSAPGGTEAQAAESSGTGSATDPGPQSSAGLASSAVKGLVPSSRQKRIRPMSLSLVMATAVNPALGTAWPCAGWVICPASVSWWSAVEEPSSKWTPVRSEAQWLALTGGGPSMQARVRKVRPNCRFDGMSQVASNTATCWTPGGGVDSTGVGSRAIRRQVAGSNGSLSVLHSYQS